MAKLTVSRDSGYADRIRKYRVLVDGTEVGQVGDGESLTHEVQPGSHTVQAKIDWCGSRVLDIEVPESGSSVNLRSASRGWLVFAVIFFVVFYWNGYVVIEEATRDVA